MHILWLKTELLHPIDKGGKIRTYHMLRALKARHRITYLTLNDGGDEATLSGAGEYCDRVIAVPFRQRSKRSPGFYAELAANLASGLPYAVAKYRSDRMARQIEETLAHEDVDVIVCDFLFPSINFRTPSGRPTVLFQHNVEASIWRRHAEVAGTPWARRYMREQWRRMRAYEGHTCRRFDHVVAVSPEDREALVRDYGVEHVSCVPTGVDTDYFQSSGDHSRAAADIVFTGSMDWLPNEDAVLWFEQEILPRIVRDVPEARLMVVGRKPSRVLRDLARDNPRIIVTESVPDVRPYLERAAVFVVPIRIGSGTRLKIFEAMAMNAPVVSTTVGAEGLPVRHEEELLIADDPEAFARSVVRLLQHPMDATRLSGAAAKRIRRDFSWRHVGERFAAICEAVRAGHAERAIA